MPNAMSPRPLTPAVLLLAALPACSSPQPPDESDAGGADAMGAADGAREAGGDASAADVSTADRAVPEGGGAADVPAVTMDVVPADDVPTMGDDVPTMTTDVAPPPDAPPPADAGVVDAGALSPGCSSGGQTASSQGLEAPFGTAVVGLCRQALHCPSTWTFAPPDMQYRYSGTPNQKLLWRVWYYGWAQRAGTAADVTDARNFLLDFFAAQIAHGHYAISDRADEVLTTSHYEIWSNGMSCARLLSVVYADASLLDATGQWWRQEQALYNVLQRGNSVDAPGARFPNGGLTHIQLRDVIFNMIAGNTLPSPANNPSAPFWSNYYNVGAWTLREVYRLGDDLGGARGATAADLPHLHDPLYLHTRGADYVYEFPALRAALDPMFWVARINGTYSHAQYRTGVVGTNTTDPAPTLTGDTVTVIPGS